MNSGDNNDQIPPRASAEDGAVEDPTQNLPEEHPTGEALPRRLKAEGQPEGSGPDIPSPTNADGGEREHMSIQNLVNKECTNKLNHSKSGRLSKDEIAPEQSTNGQKVARSRAAQSTKKHSSSARIASNVIDADDQSLEVIRSMYGPNVKIWFEAQDIYLKREEAQKAFSTTVDALCKDHELKEDLKRLESEPFGPNPLSLIIKRCIERNYLLGSKDLKKFEKELKRFNFDLGTTNLTLRGFMHFSAALKIQPIDQLLRSAEWQALPREYKFLELLLELHSHGLIKAEDNTGNLYSALPPEIKKLCGRFDGELKELIELRSLLERDSVKKHLNGTRLAGLSPEDRFLSLLLNLVEKEGLDPATDYRLVYGALPLKRKSDLIDSHIKINYLTQLRKVLDRDSVKKQLKDWSRLELSPEERFVELVLCLRAEKLISPEMSESQIFSALPPKIRSEMKLVERPYADIANFRAFFSGQSVQARLHMLVGSDKTPWDKFEELNNLLYDPSNEGARGVLKGNLPADYFELHSWLPPHLRAVTSPYPDEEDSGYDNSSHQTDEGIEPEESTDNDTDSLNDQDESCLPLNEIEESNQVLSNNKQPEPELHGLKICQSDFDNEDVNKTIHRKENVIINKPVAETVSANPNPIDKAVQVRVSLGFAPRFGDHSIRQKTSLSLEAYRPSTMSPSSINRELESDLVTGNIVNELGSEFTLNRIDETPDNLNRAGRTWGDAVEEDVLGMVNLEAQDDELQDYNGEEDLRPNYQPNTRYDNVNKVIELGSSDSHHQPTKYQEDSVNLQHGTTKSLETRGISSDGWTSFNATNTSLVQPTEVDRVALFGDIDSEAATPINVAEALAPVEASSIEPIPTQVAYDNENSDSVSDHLAYTAAANISAEERLLEFAVFLNRNKMLAATNSFKELYEKLPADIKPGFKTVDLDLHKFLEFRQDISRHFVKEHLRSTKERGLEGEDRFAEFISFLRKNGLMPSLSDSAELYKHIPIELKREFGNVLPTEPVNIELRKYLEMEVVKEQIATLEDSAQPPEDRLVELGIFLELNSLTASIDSLNDLHIQLPFDMRRSFKKCDANLKVITSIRSVIEKEMIKEHLRNSKEAGISDEERFIELVIFLERNELIAKGTSPGDIYTALPSYLKSELKRSDFPSEAVVQVRDCLDKPAVQQQVELLKKMWFSNQEKFMELAVFMKQNGYMPSNADATLLYCGLPANLKKELSIIDMPLDAVVQLRKNLEREFVKAHIKSSENDHLSPEERFVELIVFLYRNELMPDIHSLDDVYTALPSDLRLEFSRTEIPLEQILLFRDILDKDSVRKHWNQSRTLGGSGEDRFADLVVFLKREGLLLFEDNLGYFYTALPVEFKRELSNFIFKVDTITRLKSAIKAAESSASV